MWTLYISVFFFFFCRTLYILLTHKSNNIFVDYFRRTRWISSIYRVGWLQSKWTIQRSRKSFKMSKTLCSAWCTTADFLACLNVQAFMFYFILFSWCCGWIWNSGDAGAKNVMHHLGIRVNMYDFVRKVLWFAINFSPPRHSSNEANCLAQPCITFVLIGNLIMKTDHGWRQDSMNPWKTTWLWRSCELKL